MKLEVLCLGLYALLGVCVIHQKTGFLREQATHPATCKKTWWACSKGGWHPQLSPGVKDSISQEHKEKASNSSFKGKREEKQRKDLNGICHLVLASSLHDKEPARIHRFSSRSVMACLEEKIALPEKAKNPLKV